MASLKLTVYLLLLNLCCFNAANAQPLENTDLSPLMKRADSGSAEAQYQLGEIFRKGKGVATNYQTAKAFYQAAGQQEHVMAQIELGLMYYLDQLGSNQFEQAYYWFHKAAEHNHPAAQWLLGVMYFNGQGRDKDNIKSYFWLSLASEQNHSTAQLNKSQMQGVLSTEEHQQVKKMIDAFKKKLGQPTMVEPNFAQAKAAVKPQKLQSHSHPDKYRIQLGAFSDANKVTSAQQNIKRKTSSLLSTKHFITIQPNSSHNKTDLYKLQLIGFEDVSDANALCKKLKQKNVACFVINSP